MQWSRRFFERWEPTECISEPLQTSVVAAQVKWSLHSYNISMKEYLRVTVYELDVLQISVRRPKSAFLVRPVIVTVINYKTLVMTPWLLHIHTVVRGITTQWTVTTTAVPCLPALGGHQQSVEWLGPPSSSSHFTTARGETSARQNGTGYASLCCRV